MSRYLPVVSAAECTRRLELIFPRAAFDTVLSNPLAGTAVAAMIYLGAVTDESREPSEWRYVRPSMVMWMNDDILGHDEDAERDAWFEAARGGSAKKKVTELLEHWGLPFAPAYADNSRETLRDETFRAWDGLGAVRQRAGLATSSSAPRWVLDSEFAALFSAFLTEDELMTAIDTWATAHMSTEGKMRAYHARQSAETGHAVTVLLPGAGARVLEAGPSSLILKSVIEQWAPRKLRQPLVLSIAESRQKQFVADKQLLSQLGIEIDTANLLPDALIADTDSASFGFWIIEAVATDGPITEARKEQLTRWAARQGILAEQCQFLTAFEGRNAGPARRRLKDLAVGSYAWFVDEPENELLWRAIDAAGPSQLAAVTPLRPRA